MTKATNSCLLKRMHFLSHHLKWIFMAGLNNQEAKCVPLHGRAEDMS